MIDTLEPFQRIVETRNHRSKYFTTIVYGMDNPILLNLLISWVFSGTVCLSLSIHKLLFVENDRHT